MQNLPSAFPESSPTERSAGWFPAMRGEAFWEVINENPLAYVLAAVIAQRARYTFGFHAHNLALGEAFLGDYEKYGMSEREYRTAKQQLAKGGFATFRATNKGTIAKLTDTRLFAIFPPKRDGQNDRQPAGSRRTNDGQTTTNKEQKNKRTEEGEAPAGENGKRELSANKRITFEQELERVRAKIKTIKDNYEGLQTWQREDRIKVADLRSREKELMELLEVKY
jgi:hypothetical protein